MLSRGVSGVAVIKQQPSLPLAVVSFLVDVSLLVVVSFLVDVSLKGKH